MEPVAAPADVGEDERYAGVATAQRPELGRIGRFLSRPLVPAVLPDVMQHRHAMASRRLRRSDRAAGHRLAGSRPV